MVVVIYLSPLCCEVLGLFNAFDDVWVKPFVPSREVLMLDIGVQLGLTRLDVQDGSSVFRSLFHQLFADIFRTVAHPARAGLPRHSMILSKLRKTFTDGIKKSSSMPRPSRMTSSRTVAG
ncbi:MAG: hypothetical protein CFE32_05810 [Alphaproteobacteria bacterium PA3]|nr:MAG: hypothetical protein CFE32_05810 [Alphaproteobacteria bacterium PA3]